MAPTGLAVYSERAVSLHHLLRLPVKRGKSLQYRRLSSEADFEVRYCEGVYYPFKGQSGAHNQNSLCIIKEPPCSTLELTYLNKKMSKREEIRSCLACKCVELSFRIWKASLTRHRDFVLGC